MRPLLVGTLLLGLAVLAPAGATGCDRRSAEHEDGGAREPAAAAGAASASTAASAPATPSVPVADAAASEARAEQLVIIAGGDVNLGRRLGQQLLRGEQVDPFRELEPVLRSGDLRFVNLESQLSDQDGETQSPRNQLIFTGPPEGADLLARAGIDVVSLANNHMWDYGQRALLETIANLRRVGIAYAGATDRWDTDVYEPAVLTRKGWSVALFAVTHIWNHGAFQEHRAKHYVAWARFDILKSKIREARQHHDVVLVSYHGGSEYMDIPMAWTREFVRAVMNAGADAVLGHHPHVPHGVGWFEGRPALYSLGNLVFHMHRDYPWTGTSYLARLTFRRDEGGPELQVEACPYHILGVTPMLFDGKAKAARERAFRQHLKYVSVTVGGTEVGQPGEHSCMKLEPPAKQRRRW